MLGRSYNVNNLLHLTTHCKGVRKAAHHAGQSVRRRHQQAVFEFASLFVSLRFPALFFEYLTNVFSVDSGCTFDVAQHLRGQSFVTVEIFCVSKNAKCHGLLQSLVLGFRRGKKLWDRNAKRSGHVPPMQCHAFVESMPFWVYKGLLVLGSRSNTNGTSYVLFRSIVSFYHSAQQCYSVLSAGFLQTVFEQFNMFPYFGCIVNQMWINDWIFDISAVLLPKLQVVNRSLLLRAWRSWIKWCAVVQFLWLTEVDSGFVFNLSFIFNVFIVQAFNSNCNILEHCGGSVRVEPGGTVEDNQIDIWELCLVVLCRAFCFALA